MNVARRNKKLKALLDVRLGPGAAVLPVNVQRINLEFARRIEDGHRGPRKFWRQCLPRLKYHNPAISMTVERSSNQQGPAKLSIYFAQPRKDDSSIKLSTSSSSTLDSTNPFPHESSNGVESFDVKNLNESDILNKLLSVTKARLYEPSSEERAELQEVREFDERSRADRKVQDKLNKVRAQEKAMLEQAKGAVS